MLFRGVSRERRRKTSICVGTHTSIIFDGFLRHVVFAEVGQEVIADDGIKRLKTFAGSCFVLGDSGFGNRWERVDSWSGGRSGNGGHGEAEIRVRVEESTGWGGRSTDLNKNN